MLRSSKFSGKFVRPFYHESARVQAVLARAVNNVEISPKSPGDEWLMRGAIGFTLHPRKFDIDTVKVKHHSHPK
jgi:hypothetical protein